MNWREDTSLARFLCGPWGGWLLVVILATIVFVAVVSVD